MAKPKIYFRGSFIQGLCIWLSLSLIGLYLDNIATTTTTTTTDAVVFKLDGDDEKKI